MKTRILLSSIFTLLVSNMLLSQLQWGISFGGDFYDSSEEIVIDNSGNSYIIGEFKGTVDFDPGIGSDIHTALGTYAGYISKLDPSGNFIWAKPFMSSTPFSACRVNSVCLDDAGNLCLTGNFTGTVDFDPGPSIVDLTAGVSGGMFILKLDPSGGFIWVNQVGDGGDVHGYSIKHDSFDNIIIGGVFLSTQPVDFDPGPGITNLISSNADFDIFVLKLDSNGNFIWVDKFGGPGYDNSTVIAIDDSDDIVVTGIFQDTVDFDPSNLTYDLTAPVNGHNVFVLKLDSNGDFVWAGSIGNIAGDYIEPYDIAFDDLNDVVLSGGYAGTIDIDPGALTVSIASNGATDGFILKLDAAGNYMWAHSIGGSGEDVVTSIDFDNSNNMYSTGYFGSSVDFNSGIGTSIMSASGIVDGFVLKTNTNGDYIDAFSFEGTGATIPFQINLDDFENIHLCGGFTETFDVDPSAATLSFTSNGNYDSFTCKFQSLVSINELEISSKLLVKVVDYLGRECEPVNNKPLIYIFDDGSTQRVIKLQ